jgi:beta-glucosidase
LSSVNFDGKLTASVDVKNTGSLAGREVVQVYVSAPEGKLNKPEGELKAFGKTRLLQPEETEPLSFVLNAKDLSSFDESASGWIAEPGTYTVKIGNSSLKTGQSATFELDKEMTVGQVTKALEPQQ